MQAEISMDLSVSRDMETRPGKYFLAQKLKFMKTNKSNYRFVAEICYSAQRHHYDLVAVSFYGLTCSQRAESVLFHSSL